jgi:hypothetical protein
MEISGELRQLALRLGASFSTCCCEMSEPVVVLFLYATQPPAAFMATRAMLVAQARESASHSQTYPGRAPDMGFPEAWRLLARDKKAAHHFSTIAGARRHVLNDARLTLHERTTLLSALDRLDTPPPSTVGLDPG